MNRVLVSIVALAALLSAAPLPVFSKGIAQTTIVRRIDETSYGNQGLVAVEFTQLAALYFLARTNPNFARILAVLEASEKSDLTIEVSLDLDRIDGAEYARPLPPRRGVDACDAVDAEAARELLGQAVGMPVRLSSAPGEPRSSQCIYDGTHQSQLSISLAHFGSSPKDVADLTSYRQSYVDTAASVYGALHTDDLGDGQVLWAERTDWEYLDATAFVGSSVARVTVVRGRADLATIKSLAVTLARTFAQ